MENIKKVGSFVKSEKGKFILFFLAFAIFLLITISRRVDAVSNPQFYGEDGVLWYPDAYGATNPIKPFLVPVMRYFLTLCRAGAYGSMFFDIKYAPLFFNLVAITVQILPALFFLSNRFEKTVPGFYQRFLLGLAYLTLPGTFETHVNLTSAHWRLALLMFLIIIAARSEKVWWKIFDSIFLLLAGLSGPFVLFAFPLALVYAYFESFKTRISHLIVLAATFLIQVYSFLFYPGLLRSNAPIGAGFANFTKMLAGKLFVTGVFGLKTYGIVMNWPAWQNGSLPVIVDILGICLMGYAFWKGKLEFKLFFIFSFLIFAAGLATPQVTIVGSQWDAMLQAVPGNRYFLFPILTWIVALIWLFVKAEIKIFKYFAGLLLVCLVLIGIRRDFFFEPYKNYDFQKQVVEFNKLSPGQDYTFRITPPGWEMTLKKK